MVIDDIERQLSFNKKGVIKDFSNAAFLLGIEF
jgi:hypothetical protein